MKMKTRKGFTLTELLIVMAIIVVLAAVAVPTFGKQLETSRETSDLEVIRNAYTEALSIAVLDATDGKLNGKIGDADSGNTGDDATWDKVSCKEFNATNNTATYQVKDLTFSQNKPKGFEDSNQNDTTKRKDSWKYVSPTFMDCYLPIVYADRNALTFQFKFSTEAGKTGNVVLNETKYKAAQGSVGDDGYVAEVLAVFSINAAKVT